MSDAPGVRGAHAQAVAEARDALISWIREAGAEGRPFLETHLLATAAGSYEIRHARDVGRPIACLDPVSSDPYLAHEIARTTASGEHRPLKTAPNLRRGWALVDLDARALWVALDYLYPACAVHWHAGRRGTLRVTHWRETAARQSGIYSTVRLLDDDGLRNTVRACCDAAVCLRRVSWRIDEDTPLDVFADEGPACDGIPCPEACSLFVSLARKTVAFERMPRREVAGLGALNDAELEQMREIVHSAAEGTLGEAREGDFEDPTNHRRIRYLAARLGQAG